MLGVYTATAGEQLVLLEIRSLIKEINDWGWLVTADRRRASRPVLQKISAAAQANLTDPKKSYISGIADALISQYSALDKAGRTKDVYLRNLKKMETAMELEPATVTVEIEKITGAPVAPVTPPTAPAEKKILGLSRKTFAVAVTGTVLTLGGIVLYLKLKK